MAAKPVFGPKQFGGGKSGAEQAARHNQICVANLKTALASIPKFVLGTVAATALDAAVRSTVQDSGRFAANWNLALNGAKPDIMPDPLEYGQSGASYGTIGQRGDTAGTAKGVLAAAKQAKGKVRSQGLVGAFKAYRRARKGADAIANAKAAYYGYRKGEGGFMRLTRGKIAAAIYPRGPEFGASGWRQPRGDKSGTAGRILLYNPLMKKGQRIASWFPLRHPESIARKGKDYQYYAMGGGIPSSIIASLNVPVAQYVAELSAEARKATAAGVIMDPFK